jgi:predicted dehydrogenase
MSFRGVLIGCGFFARNHMHGWAEADGAGIVAVCDLDRGKAEAMAAEFDATPYTDAAEMLATERPDFADVATTVESHRHLVELCLGHGAVTICQKPFAETLEDARAMVAAAEAAERPLLVHENFRWQRPLIALQRRIEDGAIGRPAFARLLFRHGFDVYANQPYLAQTERFALMDVGLHLFDVARFLLGDARDVHCRTQSLRPGIAGEDAFIATLGHESGAVCSVECSFSSRIEPEPFPQTLAWVEGDAGTLELAFDYRLRLHRDGVVEEVRVEPPVPDWGERPWHVVQDSVAAFERHVVEVLRDGAEPRPSGAHNLGTLAMALAAYRSAETGETVPVDAVTGAVG